MSKHDMKSIIYTFLDISGLKKTLTSISATILSFGVNDIAQLIAIIVGIISGCMAIRHYIIAAKLNKALLVRVETDDRPLINIESSHDSKK